MRYVWLFLQLAVASWCECVTVTQEVVRAGELAAAIPALAALDPKLPLLFAPVAGVQRWIGPVEMSKMMSKAGIPDKAEGGLCIMRAARHLTEEEVRSAMAKVVGPNVQVQIKDFSRFSVPEGVLEFPISGLVTVGMTGSDRPVLWRGKISADSGRSSAIWARVLLAEEREVLVAVRDLLPQVRILATDTTLARRRVFPSNTGTPLSPDLIGKFAPRRRIAAGTPITKLMLVDARDVEPNQRVELRVVNGAVTLKLEGEAEGGGRVGDRIWVKNLANGARLNGMIEGPARVALENEQNVKEIVTVPGDRGQRRRSMAQERQTNRVRN